MADNAAQAAAAVLEDLVADTPTPAVIEDAMGNYPPVRLAAGDLTGSSRGDEAPAQAGEQTAAQTAEEAAPFQLPSWEANTDGIEDILNTPDDPEFELEDDQDPDPVLAETDEYTDPDTAKLKARLAKLEKQNRWLAEQRTRDNLKAWRGEAARRFPLADTDSIEADSRRAVLRKAAEQQTRYEAKVKPYAEAFEALKAQAILEAKLEERTNAQQAWGKPSQGPQVPQVVAAEDDAQFDRRKFRNPHDLIVAKLKAGKYGPV